jgi:hypothetical protein
VGLEARSHANILQARFQYTILTGVWKYEDAGLTYRDFTFINANFPSATIERAVSNTSAGSNPSWTRIVIDPFNQTIVGFEAPVLQGTKAAHYTYDLRPYNIPLASNGSAGTPGALYLPFTYTITQSANAEPAYTTDWCLSRIPTGINPFLP